jgi:hypothetical protein
MWGLFPSSLTERPPMEHPSNISARMLLHQIFGPPHLPTDPRLCQKPGLWLPRIALAADVTVLLHGPIPADRLYYRDIVALHDKVAHSRY